MSPEARAAHLATLGWRVVASIPPTPADVTYDHIAALFSGDIAALRDIARLAAAPAHARDTGRGEPPAASAPRRSSAKRHIHHTAKQEASEHARHSA